MRAAAAHKVKDFCLALDKSVQEQVSIDNHFWCIYNAFLLKGDHDPPSAVRQRIGDRRKPTCEVSTCFRKFVMDLTLVCYLYVWDRGRLLTVEKPGDHGSESNPWENKHNRTPPPPLPLTIERRMS